jgi:hypothetical protein
MWNYPGVGRIYTRYTLTTALYSTVAAAPVFFLVRLVSLRFAGKKEERAQ